MNHSFKKIIAIILCMVMVSTNTITYFAETNNIGDESTTVESVTTEETEAEEDESESSDIVEETFESIAEELEETSETEVSLEESYETTTFVDETNESVEEETSEAVSEEKVATASDAENEASGDEEESAEDKELDSEDIKSFGVATLSEAKANEFAIENIATVSDIEIATTSDARSDVAGDDENSATGFLYLDYEAPKVPTRFRGRLFGAAASYDSRTIMNPANTSMSIIPPMRDQGSSYETCWAFSTIGMMEINARLKGLVDNESDSNLSEAALAYFLYDGMKQALDPSQPDYDEAIDKPGVEGYDKTFLNTTGDVDFAKFRGRQDIAAMALSSYLGATVENSETGYDNLNTIISNFKSSGRGLPGKYAFNSNSLVVKDVKFINKNDRDIVKQAIIDYGSVGIAYAAGSSCKEVGGQYYYYRTSGNANHAIIVVGWDDNVPTSNFLTAPEEPGAWLCRNSYGTDYADGGYFWISYCDKSLDGTMYAIEVEKAGTYDYNYHYDTNGEIYPEAYNFSVSEANPIRFANIFKVSADHNQLLKAINVGVGSVDTTFNIKIYTKNSEMSFPADGTLVSSATVNGVSKDTAGLYMVELSNPVALAKNSYYSIIVEGTRGTYVGTSTTVPNCFAVYSSRAQASIARDSQNTMQFRNAAALKQSYRGYGTITSAGAWEDVNAGGLQNVDGVPCGTNLRIKGLTVNNDTLINFDGNGASNTMDSQVVAKGVETNIKSNEFVRHGYTFNGWKVVGTDAPYADGGAITITSEITLKAQWTAVTYTINYNANGGNSSEASFAKTYGVDAGTLATATKTGYDFAGWYVDNTTFNTQYTRSMDIYNETATLYSIYAKWNPKTYTLDLQAVGGNPGTTPVPAEYTYGTALSLPMDYKKGEVPMTGWYTEYDPSTETYSGTRYTSIPAVPPDELVASDTITLYARYGQKYSITYQSGGGSGSMGAQTVYEGVPVVLNRNAFTRSGYSFSKWKASNGAEYGNGANIGLVNSNLTLTAVWTKEKTGGGGNGGGGGGVRPAPQAQVDKVTTLSVSFENIPLNYANESTATWKVDDLGRWHINILNAFGQSAEVKDSWVCLDVERMINGQATIVKDFYFFDNTGAMVTGWLTDGSGKKYYLDQSSTSEVGKMARGWKAIGTNYYYFNTDGTLFVGGVTPDGYNVDANGMWIK